jgi:putative transposase
MMKRIPASMRTRESLSALIEGRLLSPDGRSERVRRATRLILDEALEAETRDALGRDDYERGAEEGRGTRTGTRTGHRPGHRTGRLTTAEGAIEFSTPQIAGRDEPFRSGIREPAKGRPEALEDLAVEMEGPRAFGPGHRGRVPRRRRAAPAFAHRRLRAGRAALAGLPGLRPPAI